MLDLKTLVRSLLLASCALIAIAHAAPYVYMPPGQRMDAESWKQLPPGSPVADPLARGGKAVLLKRDGPGMRNPMRLERTWYALSVWARCPREGVYMPPAYLELTVGKTTHRVRVRYNLDRNAYLPGYGTNCFIDKHKGYDIVKANKDGQERAKVYVQVPNGQDRWYGENTRIYFPVDVAGDCTLELKLGARSHVDLLVDRVELRDVLAHLTPGATKKQRVLVSEEELKAWRKLCGRDARARALVEETRKRVAGQLALPDEHIWQSVPPPHMPRSQQAGPCPIHGEKVFRAGGGIANPWLGSRLRYHVKCPVGGEEYPTNAYEKGDMTSGKYPDDGWGAYFADNDGTRVRERNALFVGRRVYTKWQGLTTTVHSLARQYVVTGEEKLAHKAAVMLAAIAYYYPGYDYRFQSSLTFTGYGRGGIVGSDVPVAGPIPQVHYNGWGCGKIFYSGWTGGHFEYRMMAAYDLLFPAIIKDQALLKFVGSKLPWVRTFDDLRELFDRYLLAVYSDALIRGQARSANSGWESSAAGMGAIQDGREAERILSRLFSRSHLDGTESGGFQDAIVNMLSREGVGLIYSPMYLFGWAKGLNAVSGRLPRIADEDLRKRYSVSGAAVGSRIQAMPEFARNIRVAGQFLPNVGDTSRAQAHTSDHFLAEVWPMFVQRWRRLREPQDAALALRFAPRSELLMGYADDVAALEADAKKAGGDLQQPSRVIGGYGAVVLESGLGQPDPSKKGAVFLPFGMGWGHSHRDTLNLELFAKGYRVLPDKGRLHGSTIYHNVVQVDRTGMATWGQGARFGWLNHFAPGEGVRFADLGARPHLYAKLDRYRRAVAYVDAPGDNQYVFDVFQVDGGNEHALGLHGPPHSAFVSTPKLGPGGKLAKATYAAGRAKNPLQAAGGIAGPVALDWKFVFGRTTRETRETDVHMRAKVWGGEGGSLVGADITGDIPFDIRCVHLVRQGKGLFSNYVTLMDPYEKTPFVKSSRRLAARGKHAARAAALEVSFGTGRRDVLVYNGGAPGRDTALAAIPVDPVHAGDLKLQGVFGYVARDAKGTITRAALVGGARLDAPGLALTAERAEYACRVTGMDYSTGDILLDTPLPTDANLAGSVAVIGTPERSRAYEIARISPDGRRIRVKGSALVYQSTVEGVDAARGLVHVQFPTYMCRCDPNYYDGLFATNETRSNLWRVRRVHKDEATQWHLARDIVLGPVSARRGEYRIASRLSEGAFTDADGDGRKLMYIYEIGPGQTLKITTAVHAVRGGDGRLRVTANVPFRVQGK